MHMDKELQELAFALMDKAAEKNLAKIAIQNGDFSTAELNPGRIAILKIIHDITP